MVTFMVIFIQIVKTISKSRLKARMLEEFRLIERDGVPLLVTDHGRPVLEIRPLNDGRQSADKVFAKFRGRIRYRSDVVESTANEWPQL